MIGSFLDDAAKTDGIAAMVGRPVLAEPGTALLGPIGPGTAACYPLPGILDFASRAVGRSAFIAGVPGIRAPFPDIAVHVVQAPGVRFLLADRGILALGVALEPGVVLQVIGLVAERPGSDGSRPAGIFPFCLRR